MRNNPTTLRAATVVAMDRRLLGDPRGHRHAPLPDCPVHRTALVHGYAQAEIIKATILFTSPPARLPTGSIAPDFSLPKVP